MDESKFEFVTSEKEYIVLKNHQGREFVIVKDPEKIISCALHRAKRTKAGKHVARFVDDPDDKNKYDKPVWIIYDNKPYEFISSDRIFTVSPDGDVF